MKCSNCNYKNRVKATYCMECGYKFSKKEQESAYNKTLIGKYKQYKKWYNRFSLKLIFDSIPFKIVSILLILTIGLYYMYTNGINIKILNSDNYELVFNDRLQEYYLITNDELSEIPINLYIPNRTKEITINHYDLEDNRIDKFKYDKKNDLILETFNNDYYSINVEYSNGSSEILKLYIFNESNIKR